MKGRRRCACLGTGHDRVTKTGAPRFEPTSAWVRFMHASRSPGPQFRIPERRSGQFLSETRGGCTCGYAGISSDSGTRGHECPIMRVGGSNWTHGLCWSAEFGRPWPRPISSIPGGSDATPRPDLLTDSILIRRRKARRPRRRRLPLLTPDSLSRRRTHPPARRCRVWREVPRRGRAGAGSD